MRWQLAKEDVPADVMRIYGRDLRFGPDYIIPTPFDPRVLLWEAPAVAQAAMDTGVARKHIDIDEYRAQLAERNPLQNDGVLMPQALEGRRSGLPGTLEVAAS